MMVFPEGLALKACCPERAPTLHVAVVSAIAAHLPWTLNNAVAPAGFWLRGLPQQKIGSVIRSLVAEPTEADPDYSPPPLDKRIARLAQAVPPFNIFVCAPSTLASFITPDVSGHARQSRARPGRTAHARRNGVSHMRDAATRLQVLPWQPGRALRGDWRAPGARAAGACSGARLAGLHRRLPLLPHRRAQGEQGPPFMTNYTPAPAFACRWVVKLSQGLPSRHCETA